jgi:hypothetical protein
MVPIEWTSLAFAQVEALPQRIAFEVLERVGLLSQFPELGHSIAELGATLNNCRQLNIRRSFRVVYEWESVAGEAVWILAVQHCRQKLPTGRDLRRRD